MQLVRSSRSASSSAILRSRSLRQTRESRSQSRLVGVRSWGRVGQRLADPPQRHAGRAAGLDQRDAPERGPRVAPLVAVGALRGDQPLRLPEAERRGCDAAARGQLADRQIRHLTSSVLEVLRSGHACRLRPGRRLPRPSRRRREARAERRLHLRRHPRPVRARARRRPRRSGRARSRPLPAVQGSRPAGLLRDARRPRLLPARVAGRLRGLRLAARAPSRSDADPGRRDLVRLARARPPARRRAWPSRCEQEPDEAAGLLPGRRRRARRGVEPRGDPLRRPRSASTP